MKNKLLFMSLCTACLLGANSAQAMSKTGKWRKTKTYSAVAQGQSASDLVSDDANQFPPLIPMRRDVPGDVLRSVQEEAAEETPVSESAGKQEVVFGPQQKPEDVAQASEAQEPGYWWKAKHMTRYQQVMASVKHLDDSESKGFLTSLDGRNKTARVLEEHRDLLHAEEVVNGAPKLAYSLELAQQGAESEVSKRANAESLKVIGLILEAACAQNVTLNPKDLLDLHKELKRNKDEHLTNLDSESQVVTNAMGAMLTKLVRSESERIARLKNRQLQASKLCKQANNDPANESDDEGDTLRHWAPEEVFETLEISKGPLQLGDFEVTFKYAPQDESEELV